jgi:hypothetical protein
MSTQPFTKNHRDHSNDVGFQFEFFCDKCGNGHRSSFNTSGVSSAGWGADHVKDAMRGPAWDAAFKQAIDECKPNFRQCTRCGSWVCPEVCWNQARGLCENCAPDLGEQAAAIQAQVAVEQTWEKARGADQMRGLDVTSQAVGVGAPCRKCQAALKPGSKFCAQCGTPAEAAGPKFCSQCGGELAAGSRFCSQCGKPSG